MKKVLLMLLLAICLIPASCNAEKSAVLIIVDGMGSSYIYPWHSPTCADGSPLPGIDLQFVEGADALYELWVPEPETESGNAVIATGCSDATQEAFSYYGATVYDVLREEGYLSMAIVETGDNADMRGEPDIIVHERNNSIYTPYVSMVINGKSVSPDLCDLLMANPPVRSTAGADRAGALKRYDNWPLEKAAEVVEYMGDAYSRQNYLLVVSVGGTDMAAHEEGFSSYSQAIKDIDAGLVSLAAACREAGVVMMVTADHGMSFSSPNSKGAHASEKAADRNESRLAPLLVFTDGIVKKSGTFGQECLAPTLLSLMECPDTLSVGDGTSIPYGDHPSLYLVGDESSEVTIDGPEVHRTAVVNGSCRVGPLSVGRYTISSSYGTSTVELDRDRTVKVAGPLPGLSVGWSWWLPCVLAVIISAAGLAVALHLLKGRQ